jgi:hypothetical protein
MQACRKDTIHYQNYSSASELPVLAVKRRTAIQGQCLLSGDCDESNLGLLSQFQSVINLDSKVPHCTLKFGMT